MRWLIVFLTVVLGFILLEHFLNILSIHVHCERTQLRQLFYFFLFLEFPFFFFFLLFQNIPKLQNISQRVNCILMLVLLFYFSAYTPEIISYFSLG